MDGLSVLPSPEAPAQEGTFFTKLVAGAFILKQFCCCHCAAKHHPGSLLPASGLQNPKSTALELLTDTTCILKDSVAIFQKNTRYPVICSYCIQHDAASHRGVLLSQNKWSEIQGKSNSWQLFKLRSQSPQGTAVSITLSMAHSAPVGMWGHRELFGQLWVPLVYLKDGPKGQMICLALGIMTEELNGLPVHARSFHHLLQI